MSSGKAVTFFVTNFYEDAIGSFNLVSLRLGRPG